ncbi:MAG TPA: hypothetical protein VIJ75_11585 [Hanamia sp.]
MDYWLIIPDGIVQEIEEKCLNNIGRFTPQFLLDDLNKFVGSKLESLDHQLFKYYCNEIVFLSKDTIKRALNKRPDNGVYLKKNIRLLDLLSWYTFNKNWIEVLGYFEIEEKDIQIRKVKVANVSNSQKNENRKEIIYKKLQPYTAEWYVITPFFPCISYDNFKQKIPLTIKEKGDGFVRLEFDNQIDLYWFNYGVAIWCMKFEVSLNRIFEFSLKRREFFKQVLDGDHLIHKTTKEIIEIIHKSSNYLIGKTSLSTYSLSIINLLDSKWDNDIRLNALKLFSNPSMLYSNYRDMILEHGLSDDVKNILTKTEIDYLESGIFNQEFDSFTVQGIIEGFATWAGVSFHIQNKENCIPCYDFIFYEIKVQSFWALLSHYKSMIFGNKENFANQHSKENEIRKHISEIYSVLPREPIAMRLFKETVIKTSRIDKLYQEFKEITKI